MAPLNVTPMSLSEMVKRLVDSDELKKQIEQEKSDNVKAMREQQEAA